MKNNRKGFTMAELLIVVAIIAVLVAVAIPVFNNQLEKSRDATTVANIRNAYAEIMVQVLEKGTESQSFDGVDFKSEGREEGFAAGSGVDQLPNGLAAYLQGDGVDAGAGKGKTFILGLSNITTSGNSYTYNWTINSSGS